MLVFIDESGHPHPNDPNSRPIVVAVCIDAENLQMVSKRIHALKRDFLKSERMELKGVNLLNRGTYRRKPEYVAFLEEFFGALLNLPITVFGVIMHAPFAEQPKDDDRLPNRFRYLVQRIELLAEEKNKMATIMFDGDASLFGGVGWQFNGFLYRSEEGRTYTRITDAPAFVDSKTSAGIQIADMVASVIRQYEQAELYRTAPPSGDSYLYAIRRWHNIIETKTRDLTSHDGDHRHGLYRMRQGEL